MTKAVIKKETREETILREYRHCRQVLEDEEKKLKHIAARVEDYRLRHKEKLIWIKSEQARFDELRKASAEIIQTMLAESAERTKAN